MKKQVKQCWITVRYEIKLGASAGTICARIVNEQGTEYTTCIHADGRTSCTCTAHTTCYHIRHLIACTQRQPTTTTTTEQQPQSETSQDEQQPATVAPALASTPKVAHMSQIEAAAPTWMMRGCTRGGALPRSA
jgi:hypothetical protein